MKTVDKIIEPKTRAEAMALARRAYHWSGATRFADSDRAALVSILTRNGWVLHPRGAALRDIPIPPGSYPFEDWRHPDVRGEWFFGLALYITFSSLAGRKRTNWSRLNITPLPEATR